ncbi:DHS-like NAD/FAD-binding domain-containing protein [Kockovaella imperatae]|uniref:NAD-dependent protein deacetylase n=1 Tax=Kockovaella imperatae TaxID=4999 RepID=A0A1Y1UQU9_9TREE|nr:DHS-like NAD/FAD-binding domain-containing protein [Kockovaella imperatae]ORX40458.1 DHS-like NAD/FAD-binding domain-containing protein [Kockovaella imperatae]
MSPESESSSEGSSPSRSVNVGSHICSADLEHLPDDASIASRTGDAALRIVAQLIKNGKAKRIVVLAGAGMSTSAGIPDFRSPGTGLYNNLQALNLPHPQAVFELGYFVDNPKPFWTLAKELYPGKHFPTPAHYFLALLAKHNVLEKVFTQNIDTLEQLTGMDQDLIIEAHGSFATAHCLACRAESSTEHVLKSGVRRGEVVRCPKAHCEGLVKPDIVFFGEGLPEAFFDAMPCMRQCDLCIIIGTSLQVQPFARLPNYARPHVPRILINREAVGLIEKLAKPDGEKTLSHILAGLSLLEDTRPTDMFYQGDADDAVRKLAEEIGWADELEQMIQEGHAALAAKWGQAVPSTPYESSGEPEIQDDGKVPADEIQSLQSLLKDALTKRHTQDSPDRL